MSLRRDHAHLPLDPALDLVVDAHDVAPRGGNERADDHLDDAGLLLESVAPPELTRVVGNRQDRRSGARGERGAADAVASPLAGRHARALGKARYPQARAQALRALLDDLLARRVPARAIDRDAANRHQAPADEGQPQQLLLHDPALRREAGLDEDRLPRRLVLRHDDRGFLRHLLPAAHLAGDAKAQLDPTQHDHGIGARGVEGAVATEEAPRGDYEAERHGDGDRADQEQDGAQRDHAGAMSWRLASARSSKTSALAGIPPSARVFVPLPVSTRIGCAPTASAACRSLRLSPIAGTPLSSVWNRAAISSSMPVRGLRQAHSSAAVCGQKNSASVRPPRRNILAILLSLMALSLAMSKSPRPIPDSLVATAMRKPFWFRRAIASIEPGIGRHSAGDLI